MQIESIRNEQAIWKWIIVVNSDAKCKIIEKKVKIE